MCASTGTACGVWTDCAAKGQFCFPGKIYHRATESQFVAASINADFEQGVVVWTKAVLSVSHKCALQKVTTYVCGEHSRPHNGGLSSRRGCRSFIKSNEDIES